MAIKVKCLMCESEFYSDDYEGVEAGSKDALICGECKAEAIEKIDYALDQIREADKYHFLYDEELARTELLQNYDYDYDFLANCSDLQEKLESIIDAQIQNRIHHSHKQKRAVNGTFTSLNPKTEVMRVTKAEKKVIIELRLMDKLWETILAYKRSKNKKSNAKCKLAEGFYYVLVNPDSYQSSYIAVWQRGNYWDGTGKMEPIRLGTELPKNLEECKEWFYTLEQRDGLLE